MHPYRDLSGESGVAAYEERERAIVVRFKNGDVYRYDWSKPGRAEVEEMKRKAREGRGLSTYISQNVRERYANKLEL